jgi:hypothetical protein
MAEPDCPFHVGDTVRYQPSGRGRGLEVMSSPQELLTPGKTYIVESIQGGKYLVVQGYKHPGGGLYWAEFEPA